ncbi:unnamed protein product [Periconia digitata]|uniref:Mitochondrial intermediate peptidase n=1 Tax=Periconia digitata TaxID=1303443 RepID=A0A9W4UNB7_9PLEO|nr:unnamed protein product [Periconia digitata]
MLKRLAHTRQSSWVCSRCFQQSQQPRRFNSNFGATSISRDPESSPSASNLFGLSAKSTKEDDQALRKIFDDADFWADSRRASKSGKPTGIAGNKFLSQPGGFKEFADITLQRCSAAVEKVSRASSIKEYKGLVKDLDRLSDLLCSVIDLADFVRSTHPDRRMQMASHNAYAMTLQYMNKLNTTTILNDQLKKAAGIPEVWNSWSEQEQVVAKILMADFSRSAIEMPESARQQFVDLSGEIAQVGTEFVEQMGPQTAYLQFDSRRMKGFPPNMVQALTTYRKTRIGTMNHEAQVALSHVEDAEVRRELYMAVRTADRPSIARLEKMLKKRADLAKLSGYETFAHMALEDKMAKSPEAVNQFLGALAQDSKHQVSAELQELLELKKADAHLDNNPNQINAWDKFYYSHKVLSGMNSKLRTPDFLSAYFSIGTVMQGLSRLFDRLYGLRLVPRHTQPGEVWEEDVRRLDVVSDTDGHVAVLYCDLFSRPGKTPNPAHFTLRCSREISAGEVEEMTHIEHNFPPNLFSSPLEIATSGMDASFNKKTGSHFQLPTIALICDFSKPQHRRPTLLNFNDVRTLFHEMGHALHSFLGRTALQNVSGTRCATDFAELPSVLMEHFATCPSVLGLFARHWETDAPLPVAALENRLAIDIRMRPAETEAQILLAMLDQAYHSSLPLSPDFSSTEVYHDVYNTYASVPEPAGTAWQGFFGHLYGYGATYYSYLFDRAIAGKIWTDVFQKDGKHSSIDRENGEKYKEEVLRWGGGRSGWKCIAGVLGDAKLAEGGEVAMKEVGKWGVREPGEK